MPHPPSGGMSGSVKHYHLPGPTLVETEIKCVHPKLQDKKSLIGLVDMSNPPSGGLSGSVTNYLSSGPTLERAETKCVHPELRDSKS